MTLLTEAEIAEIRAKAKRLAAGDEHKEWNMIELSAALKIIYKVLGPHWYAKSGKGLDTPPPAKPPSDYDFLLKKNELPPITALLRGGRPENYIRLIQLAGFLKVLDVGTNLREKLGEYERKGQKSNISIDSFNSVFFELKIASYFRRKGFRVHFIREEKKKKTPDLKIASQGGDIFVECKKKRPQTQEETAIAQTCQKIEVGILNAMMRGRVNYAFSITFDGRIEESDIKPVVALSNQMITSQEENTIRTLGSKMKIEAKRLLPIDVVQSSKELPRLPDFRLVQHFTWSAETQDSTVDLMRVHDLDVPIRNYRTVAIFSTYVPSKVRSALNSVRDAATQLVSTEWPGMVAVEVALGNRSPEEDLTQMLANTPETLASLPQVSSILYCLEQGNSQGNVTSLRTIFHGYRNPVANRPLPTDILEATKITVEEGMTSLLS